MFIYTPLLQDNLSNKYARTYSQHNWFTYDDTSRNEYRLGILIHWHCYYKTIQIKMLKNHSQIRQFVSILTLLCVAGITIATDFVKLANLASQRYGESAQKSILELQSLTADLKKAPEEEKLRRINSFFNEKISFEEDISLWGEKDYWATPLEAIGKKRGDCEDYSIAKYIFLRETGIPNEKLKLTYVRAQVGGPHSKIFQAHMVLSYYETPTSEPIILDNLISDVREASRRIDLTPIFSFNSEGLWAGTANNTKGTSLNNLSRWRNVLARIQQDGFE